MFKYILALIGLMLVGAHAFECEKAYELYSKSYNDTKGYYKPHYMKLMDKEVDLGLANAAAYYKEGCKTSIQIKASKKTIAQKDIEPYYSACILGGKDALNGKMRTRDDFQMICK